MTVRTGNKFTYIDLFAGCGGLSPGLHNVGWKALFAIEKSGDAFKEKKAHLKKLRGHIDLVAGGPPCQGFSTAGKRDLLNA